MQKGNFNDKLDRAVFLLLSEAEVCLDEKSSLRNQFGESVAYHKIDSGVSRYYGRGEPDIQPKNAKFDPYSISPAKKRYQYLGYIDRKTNAFIQERNADGSKVPAVPEAEL